MDYEFKTNEKTAETKCTTKVSTFGKFLMYSTGGIAISVSLLSIPFLSPAFRKVCLPYVPATTKQLRGVTTALRGRSGRLLDVGSGDGRIVFEATKLGFKADGVELNLVLVCYSKISALLKSEYKEAKFYRQNLWTFNLMPYNNIVIFGVQQMMKDFEKKLLQEVKDGTVIVACRFPLPNMVPVKTIGQGVDTVWKYVVKR